MIKKPCCSRFSLHKFVHLKFFWTQFKNVHLPSPCSLRPCISRPYFDWNFWKKYCEFNLRTFIFLYLRCIKRFFFWSNCFSILFFGQSFSYLDQTKIKHSASQVLPIYDIGVYFFSNIICILGISLMQNQKFFMGEDSNTAFI